MTDAATTPAVVSTTSVKPGWATTEFYFKLAAAGLSVAFASGVFTSNVTLSIAGIIATVLTAMGYTVSRTVVKAAASIFLIGLFIAPMTACTSSPRAKAAESAVWSCTSNVRQDLVAAALPLAASAILAAASADGKLIDDSKLKQSFSGANFVTEAGATIACAAEKAFTILLGGSPAPAVGAPASSPLVVDPAEVRRARDALRSTMGGTP